MNGWATLTVGSRAIQLGVLIANDIFADAIEYFLGQRGAADDDDDDDESEDDSDAEEIDLEKPRPSKRAKH